MSAPKNTCPECGDNLDENGTCPWCEIVAEKIGKFAEARS